MRMQADVDSQRKPVGVNSNHNGQPQDDVKAVQKRTFTRWMNVFLQKLDPPLEVHDLFTDIQDGKILMALLEELSGCKLVRLYRFRSASNRIFRLNNISKALTFLDDRHVKLLGVDASGIADGIPSVILNLIWSIILHFQVKEKTGGLKRSLSSSLSSLSQSGYPDAGDLSPLPNDAFNTLPRKASKTAREAKLHGKAIKTLLQWVQRRTAKHGVDVRDFGKSWRSGLAFLALIKSIDPDLVDLRDSLSKQPKENIRQAFGIAHRSLCVPPVLEYEDVTCSSPDEPSIITYVSMFLGHHSHRHENYTRDIEVPGIPNFGSHDVVAFGETLADDPEAKALLKSFEKSSEQLLWRRWSRRSSVASCASYSNANTTSYNQRVLEPPSPLDALIVGQEIRSWMEKGLEKSYGKQRRDESHLSISSVEGIHSFSALDSDEEDACSYILDLNKDVCQPHNPPKRENVKRVEEEIEEETEEESKYREACEVFNGSGGKHQQGFLSKVKTHSWEQECDQTEEEVVNTKIALNKGEEKEHRKRGGYLSESRRIYEDVRRSEEKRDLRERNKSDGVCVKTRETRSLRSHHLESFKVEIIDKLFTDEFRRPDAVRIKMDISYICTNEAERSDRVKISADFGPLKSAELEHNQRGKDASQDAIATANINKTATQYHIDDIHKWEDIRMPACSPTSQSFRDGSLLPQSLAASCDLTAFELELLLLLWILLYCYFLLPQIDL
ncbi:unnamed protein product [Menidia menidia]|uniref:(Atlantic silverside) hypothetical protein n=1 Tax=Menidia menidia TaxID=238744 RepID=A0A8S4B753_9TELE|nr:unnamed protein product [Menidia menidia]